MIFVGIDVAKDKHDRFIISSEGEVLADVFTIANVKKALNIFFKQSIPVQVLAALKQR